METPDLEDHIIKIDENGIPFYEKDNGWLIDNLLIAPKETFKVKLTIKKVKKGKPKEAEK